MLAARLSAGPQGAAEVGGHRTPGALIVGLRQWLLSCRDCFVDVIFLRRMHADERPDRLDHSLGLANPIMVDLLHRPILDDPGQQAGKVQDLAVGAAHGGKAGAVGENLCQPRIDVAFIVALMIDDLPLDNCIRFHDQGRDALKRGIVHRVSYGSEAIEARRSAK
jgi:hypothetical protein